MEKPAESSVAIHELVQRRWSPRAFSNRAVEPEKLAALLEAARWAASSKNEQPWRLVVAERRDGEPFERMMGCLNESNRAWAGHAPLLILVCARTAFANGEPNRHAWYDCGLAVGQLTLQALALELWVHQMAGFSAPTAREAFGVPEDCEPVSVLAVGYYGDPAALPEARRVQEAALRTRKPLGEVAFRGAWGRLW